MLYYNHQMNKECVVPWFISAHHPYYDFGILETNVGNSKRSAARLFFLIGGQFPERPGSGFGLRYLFSTASWAPLASQDKLPADKKRREHFTNRQPPTRITPRTPRSSTIMPMRWTARIIPTCIASIRTIRSSHAEAKSAECEIFYHPKKAEEDVLPGRYRKRLLHDMDSPVPDRRHYHCNRFLFLIYYKMRKAGQ